MAAGTLIQCWPTKATFSAGSCIRDVTSSGSRPSSRLCSATRAARFADRTDANVATSTSVRPAVASEEMAAQSVMARL